MLKQEAATVTRASLLPLFHSTASESSRRTCPHPPAGTLFSVSVSPYLRRGAGMGKTVVDLAYERSERGNRKEE